MTGRRFLDQAPDHQNCGTTRDRPCPRYQDNKQLCGTDNLATYDKRQDEEVGWCVPIATEGQIQTVDFSEKQKSFDAAHKAIDASGLPTCRMTKESGDLKFACASGMAWQRIQQPPQDGVELTDPLLRKIFGLCAGLEEVEFTRQEWDRLKLPTPTDLHYVEAGGTYFSPKRLGEGVWKAEDQSMRLSGVAG